MIYTGNKALEQIAILLGKSKEELENKIQSTPANNRVNVSLNIKTPTYLKEVEQFGKEKTSFDEVFSFSIYMYKTSDFFDKEVEWKGKKYDYFPTPQIDYSYIHINMNEKGEYITFDTSVLANELDFMICYEDNNDFCKFEICFNNELVNTINFEQMKAIVDNFVKNQDNENAVENLVESFKKGYAIDLENIELDI